MCSSDLAGVGPCLALGVGGFVPGHPALASLQLLLAGGLVRLKLLDLLFASAQLLLVGVELSLASCELCLALGQLHLTSVQPLAELFQAALHGFGVRDEVLLQGRHLLTLGE